MLIDEAAAVPVLERLGEPTRRLVGVELVHRRCPVAAAHHARRSGPVAASRRWR